MSKIKKIFESYKKGILDLNWILEDILFDYKITEVASEAWEFMPLIRDRLDKYPKTDDAWNALSFVHMGFCGICGPSSQETQRTKTKETVAKWRKYFYELDTMAAYGY